jgi:hypothetical protein
MTNVSAQKHYTLNEIQPIEYIKNIMTQDEFVGFLWGNVIKYMSRWKAKGKVEDLKKANVYLNWMIDFVSTGNITVEESE